MVVGRISVTMRFRLLPTVLAGSTEGCNTSDYWGFLAHTLLCGSKNPLVGYGVFRLVKISVPAPASNPSYIVETVCLFCCEMIIFFLTVGKLQWADGLKEG